jgi:hypothetical protein
MKSIIIISLTLISLSIIQAQKNISLEINNAIVNITWEYSTDSITFDIESALNNDIDTSIKKIFLN